jgi:hypothetical protein
MSETLVSVQNIINQTLVTIGTETVVQQVAETEIFVTSLGSQGVQGIQGAQGIQGIQGPVSSLSLSMASDVDISTIKTGSMLIYNQSTDKWVSNDVLSAQYVDSGQY